jgi:hypothetical protein
LKRDAWGGGGILAAINYTGDKSEENVAYNVNKHPLTPMYPIKSAAAVDFSNKKL